MLAILPATLATLILLAGTASAAPPSAEKVDAQAAFEKLSDLAGTWRGGALGEGVEALAEAADLGETEHLFELSAGGTVVMETMAPGTPHEMINMYHRDGDDLVLTHYCSSGNQPRMRLNRATSTTDRLVFDFAGGSNLDPEHDDHIHSAVLTWSGADRLDSRWLSESQGAASGAMTFQLKRSH